MVLSLDCLLALLVFGGMLLGILDHPVDVSLRQSP